MSACPFIVSRILDYAISPSPPVPWDVPSERCIAVPSYAGMATLFRDKASLIAAENSLLILAGNPW
jgi:hypothetical protein